MLEIKEGKPYLWKSNIYGNVAVHIESVNDTNGVVKVTVDGGTSARQVIDHPELAEGWFVLPARLHKRVSVTRKTGVGKVEIPAEITNTIREVPGVGKVAVITNDPPKLTRLPSAEQVRNLSAKEAATLAAAMNEPLKNTRKPRRLSLNSALKEAMSMRDNRPGRAGDGLDINWPTVPATPGRMYQNDDGSLGYAPATVEEF